MKFKPILLVHGEPNSIFLEIYFKCLKYKNFKSPLILICSQKILKFQMKKLNFKMDINLLNPSSLNKIRLNNNKINIIDINYNGKIVSKISIDQTNI